MHPLAQLFADHEDWLMRRTLDYAKQHGYTRYTSTLEEAWRLSISGLTASLSDGLTKHGEVPELDCDEDFEAEPLAEFGIDEAKRHRSRGVTLAMFLGLMKYYRQSYIDLIKEKQRSPATAENDRLFIERCFDRIEVAFCQEWANAGFDETVTEMQTANRFITNEKNTYLTVFESLSDPVAMLDAGENVVHINNAASRLVNPAYVSGGHYYQAEPRRDGSTPYGKQDIDSACIGRPISHVFPWLAPTLRLLKGDGEDTFECETTIHEETRLFEVKRSDMLDVSEKFTFTIIILHDITKRKNTEDDLRRTVGELGRALSEVNQLSNLLPMCASCKKIRDDKGYWSQVEQYLSVHAGTTFSHGLCPDCLKKLYPRQADEVLRRMTKKKETV